MMNRIFLILSLIITDLYAQNLIPNPGFELVQNPDTVYPYCKDFNEEVKYWTFTREEDEDFSIYRHACKKECCIPNSWLFSNDFFEKKTKKNNRYYYIEGNACISMNMYNRKDQYYYIQTPLINPLLRGQLYYCETYMSSAMFINYFAGSRAISYAFTKEYCTPEIYDTLTPYYDLSQYIRVDYGWQHIGFYFIAEGGEKYLVIGNMRDPKDKVMLTVEGKEVKKDRFWYEDKAEWVRFSIDNVSLIALEPNGKPSDVHKKDIEEFWALPENNPADTVKTCPWGIREE